MSTRIARELHAENLADADRAAAQRDAEAAIIARALAEAPFAYADLKAANAIQALGQLLAALDAPALRLQSIRFLVERGQAWGWGEVDAVEGAFAQLVGAWQAEQRALAQLVEREVREAHLAKADVYFARRATREQLERAHHLALAAQAAPNPIAARRAAAEAAAPIGTCAGCGGPCAVDHMYCSNICLDVFDDDPAPAPRASGTYLLCVLRRGPAFNDPIPTLADQPLAALAEALRLFPDPAHTPAAGPIGGPAFATFAHLTRPASIHLCVNLFHRLARLPDALEPLAEAALAQCGVAVDLPLTRLADVLGWGLTMGQALAISWWLHAQVGPQLPPAAPLALGVPPHTRAA